MSNNIRVFTGRSNPDLFERFFFYNKIEDKTILPRGKGSISQFSDGEIFFQIEESVRGMDCYILQSTCNPHNDNLMELFIISDALKRASAASVTAVFPYYGYARQDRQVTPRSPITAKLVANLVTTSGIDRIAILDVHSAQIQGFFNTPLFDYLKAIPLLSSALIEISPTDWFPNDTIIVSPDVGGVKRARNFAKKLGGCDLAIIDKRRDKPNESEVMNIIGDVADKNCILVDDMVDTAGTLCQASIALKDAGAKDIIACATHPVLSGPALDRLKDSPITKLIVTDSIPLPIKAKENNKIHVVSCANLLRIAIDRIHKSGSVSEMFV